MQLNQWKRNAAIFVGSQSISLFGSSLVQFAITWYITRTTQSGIYMTLSIVCSLLPLVFVSPFAGVWADRYDRKKLIMISDGVIALSTLCLALVFLSGFQPLWLLYVISVIRAVGGAIQQPAVNALIPSLVPQEQLTRINGVNSSVQSLLSLAAPALAGVILSVMGSIEAVLFIDVITAALAILILLRFLKIPAQAKVEEAGRPQTGEIRQGLRYIGSQPYLVHLLLFIFVVCFMIAPVSFLTPLQVVRTYGDETWKMSAAQMAYTGGMLAGGLLISVWPGFRNRIHTAALAIALMGVFVILLGTGVPFPLYIAITVCAGMMMPFVNTPPIVMLQERVQNAYLGRVFSIISMVNGMMLPMGMLLFGPLSDRVSIELLLLASGSVIALLSVVLLLDRPIRAVGLPMPRPSAGTETHAGPAEPLARPET